MKKIFLFSFLVASGLCWSGHSIAATTDNTTSSQSKVLFRSEVPIEDTWDLTPLFLNEELWEDAFEKVSAGYGAITTHRGAIGSSAQELFNTLHEQAQWEQSVEKLDEYASLRLNEDYSDPTAKLLQENSSLLKANFEETCSFIDPEILAIDDATLDRYLADPILTDWVTPLQRLRRIKSHLLSKAQEDEYFAVLGKQQVRGSQGKFYQLTNLTMNFGSTKDAQGHLVPLTQSNFPSFLREPNREVRKEAFGKFYDTFFNYRNALAKTLANAIQEHVILARTKHYPSAREAALFPDNIPTSVYDNLVATVRSRLPALHHYYELRRRALKLSDLHAYDLNVSLVPAAEKKYTFEEAITTVIAALQPLGEEYVTILEKGLRQERWCDRYENQGKRTGAFTSHASYQNHPYISMNFDGSLNTVYTLAHESGHAMHAWYTQHHQSYQNANIPIFLAETASKVNETLLTEYLLSTTQDPRERASIIEAELNRLIVYGLFSRTMYAEFEQQIHAAAEAGITTDLYFFRKTYRALLNTYYGPSVVIDDAFELQCLSLSYLYMNFYVYQYGTGDAAATSLATQLLKSGDNTPYLNFLKSGGSLFPIETLQAAGVDITKEDSITAVLDLFERRVDELEQLLKEINS